MIRSERRKATSGEGSKCTRSCGGANTNEGKEKKRKMAGWSTKMLEETAN